MASGGARVRSGPAADPNALRRSRDGREWVKLSPAGRGDRPAPPWPLPEPVEETAVLTYLAEKIEDVRDLWQSAEDGRTATKYGRELDKLSREHAVLTARIAARSDQEIEFWDRLWKMPQAVVWEADHADIQVAMYVRAQLEAMRPEAAANARTLARQYAEQLLLTIPSLHAMRYVIDERLGGATQADLVGEQAAKAKVTKPNRFRVVRSDETIPDEEPEA